MLTKEFIDTVRGNTMVQIITDSSTLITVAEGKEMGIDVLPLCVNIMDEDYRDLQVDMDDFYGKIAKGGIPKSSQPPVGEYVEAFKAHAGKKILNIAMAHGLSGTYQSACGAKEIADNKDDIEVFNTRTLCGPHRYMVEKALAMANAGAAMEEILRTLEECRDNCHSYLIVQDFDFLRRGGRLTPVAAKFASALNVKPIMEQVEEGTRLSIHGVARTIKGAAKNIKSQLEKRNVGEGYLISISHARAEKDAQEIAAVMRETFAKAKVEILDLSPAFITQGGPGCIAVQYVKM